eukprot:TRINITY_DN1008_c0_g1_i2.p1 TRINITY_DN1008_c0_g1~~TRINITY_DN1008_c0_g1_i2.p1  ORF type:complete len:511 (-),score=146.88 TRINITY_DN1008_c0_g1_i2:70-1602(-)
MMFRLCSSSPSLHSRVALCLLFVFLFFAGTTFGQELVLLNQELNSAVASVDNNGQFRLALVNSSTAFTPPPQSGSPTGTVPPLTTPPSSSIFSIDVASAQFSFDCSVKVGQQTTNRTQQSPVRLSIAGDLEVYMNGTWVSLTAGARAWLQNNITCFFDWFVGPRGPNGTVGLNGTRGLNGTTGATGPRGATGTSGPRGVTGSTGVTGATGPRGFPGARGPTGDAGPRGADSIGTEVGDAGPTGRTGSTGVTGAPGKPGAQGSGRGPKGFTGPPGNVGVRGSRGEYGVTGATGLRGVAGNTGPTGLTGFTLTGPAGPRGATGTGGGTGATGSTGATGNTGPRGYNGNFGTTGTTGWTGASGLTGYPGPRVLPFVDFTGQSGVATSPRSYFNFPLSGLINSTSFLTFNLWISSASARSFSVRYLVDASGSASYSFDPSAVTLNLEVLVAIGSAPSTYRVAFTGISNAAGSSALPPVVDFVTNVPSGNTFSLEVTASGAYDVVLSYVDQKALF